MSRRPATPPARRAATTATIRRPAPGPARRGEVARCLRATDVWPYLDGELSPARARAMATHIAGCDTCGPVAHRLCAMLEECRSAGCRALPPDVRARARARARELARKG